MTLDDYLSDKPRGTAAALASRLGVSTTMISIWRNRARAVPVVRCMDIEKETAGYVNCEDLRPDLDWSYIRHSSDFEAQA